MRIPVLNEDSFVLVDDEDFAEFSRHTWNIYHSATERVRAVFKAHVRDDSGQRYYIYPSTVLFPHCKHTGIYWTYRDGDNHNWQKANIILRNVKQSRSTLVLTSLSVPWCPFGAAILRATIFHQKLQRPDLCTKCEDRYEGPYWQCLNQISRSLWRAWRRENDER
jgi:hypothetical protein